MVGSSKHSRSSSVVSFSNHPSRTHSRQASAIVKGLVKAVVKKNRKSKTSSMNRALPNFSSASPFPPIKGYKLQYEHDGYMSVGTSGVIGTEQKFCLNGLHDPDIGNVGHQCYGWDALKVAYQRYKVNGCLVEMEFYNIQTLNAINISYLVSNPSNYADSIAGVDPDVVGERQQGETVFIQNIGAGKKIVKFFVPIGKASGITKLQFKADVDNFTADTASNPGNKVGLHIGVSDPNDGSSGGCRFKVKLTYFSMLYQREIMAQS